VQARTAIGAPLPHTSIVSAVSFSPDGKRILTGSMDGVARFWDAQTGMPIGEFHHGDQIAAVAFSPDGKRVLTASEDRTAQLWDVESRQRMEQPFSSGARAISIAFNPDGKHILIGSEDHVARLWDVETQHPISEPFVTGGPVTAVAFSGDGQHFVAGGPAGAPPYELVSAWLWDVGASAESSVPEWALEWAEHVAGERFDEAGVLVPATDIPPPVPAEARGTPFERLVSWMVAPIVARTISPNSTKTLRRWIDERLAENNPQALEQATEALPGDPLVLARLAEQLASGSPERARFYAKYATRHVSLYAEDEDRLLARPRQAAVLATLPTPGGYWVKTPKLAPQRKLRRGWKALSGSISDLFPTR
jgi:dipeptidyl aminopeptidase/acylaminoacyl peptidase